MVSNHHPAMRIPILATTLLLLLATTGCNRYEPSARDLDAGAVYIHQAKSIGPITWANNTQEVAVVNGYETAPNTTGFSAQPAALNETVAVNGASSAVAVLFAPTAVGPAKAKVKPLVSSVDANGQSAVFTGDVVKVKCAGVGIVQLQDAGSGMTIGSPGLAADQFLDFGPAPIKGAHPAGEVRRNVTLTNTTAQIRSLVVTLTGPAFTSPSATVDVPANGSITVILVFTPPALGEHWGVVECAPASGRSPRVGLVVKGVGVAADGG